MAIGNQKYDGWMEQAMNKKLKNVTPRGDARKQVDGPAAVAARLSRMGGSGRGSASFKSTSKR